MKIKIFAVYFLFMGIHCQAQEYFKSFDQTNIAYEDSGSGQAVLLIHGFISSGNSWNNAVLKKELVKKGYRVIIPDLRGNGNSDRPQVASFYADDAEIKDLKALADHLNLSSYMAIGYSRGAIVLSKLLVDESRITKAVLGGMGKDFTNPDWSRRILFEKAFSGKEPPNEMTQGAIEYAQSIGADLKVLGFLQEFQPVTSEEELSRIKVKTLVIAGDQDKDNGDPKALADLIPEAQLKIVSGDHNNTKNTETFAEEVTLFLGQ
ncbi:alpha/beta fold hydrolase [Lutimonas sp.]|uniref:alpha/beta fold hydrolase n=1 Tax=Lutimonas sp. TaxID=1872403 RepID=UPI003D9B69FC